MPLTGVVHRKLNLGAAPPWLAHRCGRAGEQGPATVYERSVSMWQRELWGDVPDGQ